MPPAQCNKAPARKNIPRSKKCCHCILEYDARTLLGVESLDHSDEKSRVIRNSYIGRQVPTFGHMPLILAPDRLPNIHLALRAWRWFKAFGGFRLWGGFEISSLRLRL